MSKPDETAISRLRPSDFGGVREFEMKIRYGLAASGETESQTDVHIVKKNLGVNTKI